MLIVGQILLFVWIPFTVGLFAMLKPVRALVLAYVLGWLILPMTVIPFEGFWDLDKVLVTNIGAALGIALFCPGRLRGYRLTLADVALGVFVFGAFLTSLTNDLGLKDGVSSATHKLFYYGVPFIFGRAVLRTREDLLDAARIVVAASTVYALAAIWEWRMSPQLHRTLYGYFQHSFYQHRRWGSYRPVVCFPHALGLGIFFGWTELLALSMHKARQLKPLLGVPPVAQVILPLVGLLTSMSFGPWGLFLFGFGLWMWWRRSAFYRWVLLAPVCFAVFWMTGRYTGAVDGEWLVSLTADVSAERAESLEYRVDAEEILLAKARKQPGFGWGGYGRNRNEENDVATDGMWVILVGTFGLVGLISFYTWWCWPIVMARRLGRHLREHPAVLPLLIALGMQAVNLLFNAFVSPVMTLMSGGVVTCMLLMRREVRARKRRTRTPAVFAPVVPAPPTT